MGWRLPTLAELLSISRDALPGSTAPNRHQTTTNYQPDQSQACSVSFDATSGIEARQKWGAAFFRAVRGGL